VAALLRLAAVTVGKTSTALGAFYRRLAACIGKAKAVTALSGQLPDLRVQYLHVDCRCRWRRVARIEHSSV
jgi:hypothetical protein